VNSQFARTFKALEAETAWLDRCLESQRSKHVGFSVLWWIAKFAEADADRLLRQERTVTDPKFCERFEILLVSTSNCVFPPTFDAETTLSRRVRLDL
jgi:hypothetical protein